VKTIYLGIAILIFLCFVQHEINVERWLKIEKQRADTEQLAVQFKIYSYAHPPDKL
jgi:hypothetical protein